MQVHHPKHSSFAASSSSVYRAGITFDHLPDSLEEKESEIGAEKYSAVVTLSFSLFSLSPFLYSLSLSLVYILGLPLGLCVLAQELK